MKIEEAVQAYWGVSLAWKGRDEAQPLTYELAQRLLHPLYVNAHHLPVSLQRQAEMLSDFLAKGKRSRTNKPKRMPKNVVQLPVARKKAVAA